MNIKDLKGNLFLLVATIIWGCTFVAQDIAAKIISPFEFQAVRTLIGAVVLVPVILFMDGIKKKNGTYQKPTKKENKDLLLGGIVCGACHCIAACLQQWGMALGTPPGKAGFITAMYIIFVPIIGLLLKKKILFLWLMKQKLFFRQSHLDFSAWNLVLLKKELLINCLKILKTNVFLSLIILEKLMKVLSEDLLTALSFSQCQKKHFDKLQKKS